MNFMQIGRIEFKLEPLQLFPPFETPSPNGAIFENSQRLTKRFNLFQNRHLNCRTRPLFIEKFPIFLVEYLLFFFMKDVTVILGDKEADRMFHWATAASTCRPCNTNWCTLLEYFTSNQELTVTITSKSLSRTFKKTIATISSNMISTRYNT